jgi:hypothetical protein
MEAFVNDQAHIDNSISHIHAIRGAIQKIISNGGRPKSQEKIVELLNAIEAKLRGDNGGSASWKDICLGELEIIFEILEVE